MKGPFSTLALPAFPSMPATGPMTNRPQLLRTVELLTDRALGEASADRPIAQSAKNQAGMALAVSVGMPTRARRGWLARCLTGSPRGFTLVELFVVVIIISIIALIAIPAITQQLRDRRTREAAERVATLYRNARMLAMGRGSAVLVSFDLQHDAVTVREAVRGGTGTCALLPSSSCTLTSWELPSTNINGSREVTGLTLPDRQEYANVDITDEAGETLLEVCFTPMGRAVMRTATGVPFVPMNRVEVIAVARVIGGATQGLTRLVTLMPNGMSRLGTSEARP